MFKLSASGALLLMGGVLSWSCLPATTDGPSIPLAGRDAASGVVPDASTAAAAPDVYVEPPETNRPFPASPDGAPAASPDATGTTGSADGSPATPEVGGVNQSFTCTLILGTNQTSEWFTAGFEALVDDAKWELLHAHSAFVELWADANSAVWREPIGSRCTQNPTSPDRVIFLALAGGPGGGLSNYPLEKWLPLLTADIKNIQSKYPSVKRIELMSYVRGPNNGTCPGTPEHRTVVFPSQDEAMAKVAAANPDVVVVAPKWAARSCADFGSNPPHPTAEAAKAWARMIAEHYGRGR
jgi:hypothetical protein